MGKVTNSNFVSFLKQCGPWEDNESQFEEHVRKNAKSRKIEPLEYRAPYEDDIAQIKDLISEGNSKILLICGRAGDGKTHFLGKLFEDPELLGVGTECWQNVLDTNSSFLTFPDVKGFRLTVVADLTQLPEDSPEEHSLYKELLDTLQDNLDGSPNPRLLVIAGNNGKILEKLETLANALHDPEIHGLVKDADLIEVGAISGSKSQFARWFGHLNDLLKDLKLAFIEKATFTNQAVTLIDMSNRINNRILQEIFDVILGSPYWQKCQECFCYEACPIQRNIKLLQQPWLQQRMQHLLFLLKADGAHLTIRNVQSLVINALLGQGFESRFNDSYLTCLKISNHIEEGRCTLESNVYDNLLGLNFKANQRDDQRIIFELMSTLNLGVSASKNLDDFLLQERHSNRKLRQDFFRQFDLFGLEDKLKQSWCNLKKANIEVFESNRKGNLNKEQHEFTLSLQALRRLVFFNVGAPMFDKGERLQGVDYDYTDDLFTDPYLMTKYPHARAYIKLTELIKNQDVEAIRGSEAAKMIILALNRIFTGLLTLSDTSEVFISANNILNLNILYDQNIFKFAAYNYGSARSINLKFIPEFPFIPVLQFIDEAKLGGDSSDVSKERKTVELLLTPKMFECLMQIAHGTTSMSLPKIDIHELLVFKDRIFAILEHYTASVFNDGNVNKLLSSISRLEIEPGGNIVLRQRFSNGG